MSMSLTKEKMVKALLDSGDCQTRAQANDLVIIFFDEIAKALESNETVKLTSFGRFETRDKKARPGRNPKTGECVEVTARRIATFYAGQKLKDRIARD
jgi:integration host factor subunit alpha